MVSTQLGQLDHAIVGVSTNVLGHHIQLFHGDEELIRPCILDADVVSRNPSGGQSLNTRIAADTIGFVYHHISHLQIVEGEDGFGVFLFGLFRHGLLLAGANGGSGERTRAPVGIGGEDGDLGNHQLVAKEVFPPEDDHDTLGQIFGVCHIPLLGNDAVKARLVQHICQIPCGGLIFGDDSQAVARAHIGCEILTEKLEILGVGDHMLGAEAEDTPQPLARHAVGQRIHVYRGVSVQEQIKGGDGLLILGVLARDGARLDETLDGLVHLPLACLESVADTRIVADNEQGLVGEVIQKTSALGVKYLHVFVQIVQFSSRGVDRSLGGGQSGQLFVQEAGGLRSAPRGSLSLGTDDILQKVQTVRVSE